MDPNRWKAISELAAVAAETAPGERAALLAAKPELRAEVESLLRFHDEEPGPLDQLPGRWKGEDGYAGRRIGPYRVIREIGSGGMGVVLLAEREDPELEQQVAIKLARISLQSGFYRERFLEERRLLARLEHPNIARLLDGGVTEEGAPFLVMPYIEGLTLDVWAKENGPDTRTGLKMFLRIADAVAFAHENLVVHRDLKPGNILVTPSGDPVLLDFGAARLLRSEGHTGVTQTAVPLLTARYASPEQIAGMAGTIRGDVYSLGVVLYELLTGRWPYGEVPAAFPGVLRMAAEGDPIPPSLAVESGVLRRQLAGDLDAILLRAIEKDPLRRYGSVHEFAADLRRHLLREPVHARRITWTYRAGRFLQRHAVASIAAAGVLFSLAGATAFSLHQARLAEREREKAVQVALFLENLLGASRSGRVSPLATGGRDLKVVDLIESAAARIGAEFASSPDIEAGLRVTIGSAQMALGEPSKAKPHVERAVALATRLYGDNHAMSTRALTARGRLLLAAGDFAGAQADFARALAWHEANGSKDLSFQHSLLAEAHYRQGDLRGARTHFERALDAMRKEFGDRHIATATMISNVAVMTDDSGDATTAEKSFEEAAGILRSLPGPPGNLVFPLAGLQRAHFFRGEYAKAKALCEESLQVALRTGGARHPNTVNSRVQLSQVKAYLGDADAEMFARETVAVGREIYPPKHPDMSRSLTALGRVLLIAGKPEDAEVVLREAHGIARAAFPKDNWRPAETRIFWGVALAAQGRWDEARAALTEGVREMRAVLPAEHPRVQEAERILKGCGSAAAECVGGMRVGGR